MHTHSGVLVAVFFCTIWGHPKHLKFTLSFPALLFLHVYKTFWMIQEKLFFQKNPPKSTENAWHPESRKRQNILRNTTTLMFCLLSVKLRLHTLQLEIEQKLAVTHFSTLVCALKPLCYSCRRIWCCPIESTSENVGEATGCLRDVVV